MLTLTRKEGQSIAIGDDVVIEVARTGKTVQLRIAAPQEIRILRGELVPHSTEAKGDGRTT